MLGSPKDGVSSPALGRSLKGQTFTANGGRQGLVVRGMPTFKRESGLPTGLDSNPDAATYGLCDPEQGISSLSLSFPVCKMGVMATPL